MAGCLTFVIVGSFFLAPFFLLEALILGKYEDLNILTVGLGLLVGAMYIAIVCKLWTYIKGIKEAEKYMKDHPNENLDNNSKNKTNTSEKQKEPYKAKTNKSFEE